MYAWQYSCVCCIHRICLLDEIQSSLNMSCISSSWLLLPLWSTTQKCVGQLQSNHPNTYLCPVRAHTGLTSVPSATAGQKQICHSVEGWWMSPASSRQEFRRLAHLFLLKRATRLWNEHYLKKTVKKKKKHKRLQMHFNAGHRQTML